MNEEPDAAHCSGQCARRERNRRRASPERRFLATSARRTKAWSPAATSRTPFAFAKPTVKEA